MSVVSKLPEEFKLKMKRLLGDEYEAFLAAYKQEVKQGLRVNTSKIRTEDFLRITPFALSRIPWTENGFFFRDGDPVTRHPHYYAGLYYVQEPSAMTPASRLPICPGDRVLDLCAAPGGKSTELASRLRGTGVLVSNDISVSRARALLKNLELAGTPNLFVTGESPQQLYAAYGSAFDKIMIDAPCSGEGMFRKDPSLIGNWMEHGPLYYAQIQKEILSCAAGMLRPGGMMLYSTCTFAPEEDEAVISDILNLFPELEMAEPEGYEGFAPGLSEEKLRQYMEDDGFRVCERYRPECCIRIWPHRMAGEGHFAALLKKRDDAPFGSAVPDRCRSLIGDEVSLSQAAASKKLKYRKRNGSAERQQKADCRKQVIFCEETRAFLEPLGLYDPARMTRINDEVYLLPAGAEVPKLRYLRTGLWMGNEKNGHFEPSQALALAIRNCSGINVLDFSSGDLRVLRYLKGETIEIPEGSLCRKGWVLICSDGYPLGWGKCSGGTIKNKYRAGWRMQ